MGVRRGPAAASTATVLRTGDGEVAITDGPFTEGKEHLGGFTVIDAGDLDAAMTWGQQLAEITSLPIEIRPLQACASGRAAAGLAATADRARVPGRVRPGRGRAGARVRRH